MRPINTTAEAEKFTDLFVDAITNRSSPTRSMKAINSVWRKAVKRMEKAGFNTQSAEDFAYNCLFRARLKVEIVHSFFDSPTI